MLRHGLQGLQGQRIVVPSRVGERPDEGWVGTCDRPTTIDPIPGIDNRYPVPGNLPFKEWKTCGKQEL